MTALYQSPWTLHSIEQLEDKAQPADALEAIKKQREWLRQHGFEYSFVEWPDGLLALIVHPIDEAPKADLVRATWERAQREAGREAATLYEQLERQDACEVPDGH